jgi:hypothetical protein
MNKKVPAWALYLTIGIAVLLLCGGIASASSTQPEPEVRTVTETVEKEVPGKTKTVEKEVLSSTCRSALVKSAQNMSDFNSLVGSIGDAIVAFTETYDSSQFESVLAQQQIVIDDMLAAISEVMLCDSTIGAEIDLP